MDKEEVEQKGKEEKRVKGNPRRQQGDASFKRQKEGGNERR